MLTPQNVAEGFNALGIDTPEKLAGLLTAAGKYVERQNASYALDAAKANAEKVKAEAEAEVQQAQATLNALDAALAGNAA